MLEEDAGLPTPEIVAVAELTSNGEVYESELIRVENLVFSDATTDETFEALRAHFDEREIVELTWLVAVENYYNRMNRALGIGSDGLCEIDHDLPT